MSLYTITQKTFLEELAKIIPEWKIEIIPKDYLQFPEKYNMPKVIVILKHKEFSKIILEKSLQTNGMRDEYGKSLRLTTPWHLSGVYSLIATTIHPDNSKKHDELFDKIAEHFSNFFRLHRNE